MSDTQGTSEPLEEHWKFPDGWPEVPRFVVFFVAAPVPLGLPDQWAGSMVIEEEPVAWIRSLGVPAATIYGQSLIPHNSEGRPFVSFRVNRFEFPFGLGIEQLVLATGAYEKMRTGQDIVLDAEFYSRWVTGSFATGAATFGTVFELMTPLLPVPHSSGELDFEASVWAAFERSFYSLEALHRAYVTTVDDPAVRPPVRRILHPVVPGTTRIATTGEVESLRHLRVNDAGHWPQGAKGILNEEALTYLNYHMQVVLDSGHDANPHLTFVEHAKRAQHAYHARGDLEAAVIWDHVSSECLLNGVLLMTAWEEGLHPDEVAKWFEMPLRKRVRARFGERLGGSWNTRNASTVVGIWSRDVVRVRNSIVHASRRATEEEAIASHNACVDLERYVKHRLFERRNDYSRTALVFIGIPGMRDRGVSDEWLDEVIAKMEEEPDLTDAYRQWAQHIYAMVEE